MGNNDNICKDYGVLNNINYILKTMWIYDRFIYIFFLLSATFSVLISVFGVYLPSITIKGVEQQWSSGKFILYISVITIIIAILNFTKSWQDVNYSVTQNVSRQRFINRISKVTMQCEYEDLENPKMQVKIDQVANLVYTGAGEVGINGMQNGLRNLFTTLVGVFAYSTILHRLNIGIILFLIITTFICSWLKNRMNVYEYNHRNDWAVTDKKIDYINSKLTRVEFAKDIRIFHCSHWLSEKLEKLIITRAIWIKRILIKRFKVNVFEALLHILRDSVAISYIVWLVINHQISTANFILYVGSITQLSQFLTTGFDSYTNIKRASLDMNMIREYLDMNRKTKKGTKSLSDIKDFPLSITFDHVSFKYDDTSDYIIKDFSMTIKKGEKIALVGANGAGKTTLIKLLCGLYKPTKGCIYINNIPLNQFDLEEAFRLFSAVFQDNMILPYSVAQNVAMTTNNKVDKDKVKKCLTIAGLAKRLPDLSVLLVKEAQEKGIELSGGEAQKLFLARALYKDAPILLLDEPTAALDAIAESEMYLKYHGISKDKTSIFISHRLASTNFCDRILFIKDGVISEEGTHQELLNNNKDYARMYQLQSKYYQENEVDS